MKRWLIILTLLAAFSPNFAAASTRSSDIPLWKRLLAILTPGQSHAPAARLSHRASHEHAKSAAVPEKAPDPAPVVGQPEGTPAPAAVAAEGANTPAPAAATPEPAPASTAKPHDPAPAAATAESANNSAAATVTPGRTPASIAKPPEHAHDPAPAAATAEGANVLTPPIRQPARPMVGGTSGDPRCNGGQHIVSSYYWESRHTASGQPFNPYGMTAAHRTLPFGTRLTVTNPRNGQSVTVVINDRGPYVQGVSLDLSLGAAKAIGMQGTGVVCVS
jgi:rare lipoprotein A